MSEGKNPNFTEFPALKETEDEQHDGSQNGFLGGFLGRFFRPDQSSGSNSAAVLTVDLEEDQVPELQQTSPLDETTEGDNISVTSDTSRRISRLASFFKGNSKESLIDYDRSEFRRYWMPDSTVKECYECHEKFTPFRRKHHCRLCGQIFCGKCSKHSINGASLGYAGLLRVCGYCERNVDSYFSANNAKNRRTETVTSISSTDQLTPGYSSVSTVSNGPILFSGDNSIIYGADSRLHDIINSSDLKSSSDALNPSNGDPSHLSVQQLQDYQRFMRENENRIDDNVVVTEESKSSNEPEWVRNIASRRRTIDEFKSVECPAYEIQPCIDNESPSPSKSLKSSVERSIPHDLKSGDLNEIFESKLELMLDYLFLKEQLEKDKWRSVIWPLSKEICSMIQIDILQRGPEENMNILKYVHIKKLLVPESDPEYEIISGVACSKTLAHTDMPKHIDNASVMVLNGGIEYERELQKLTSIDPIIEQENEYLKNHVAKLASDMLMRAQVSLVTNVKRTVLERVARSTKATLTSLMDAQMHPGVVGFCPQFKERVVQLKTGEKKSLLIFDECNSDLGVSILLRANSRRELKLAKKILKLIILMRYSASLEISFLKMFDTIPSRNPPTCQVCVSNAGLKSDPPNEFQIELEKAQLTNSPLILFPPPYLETRIGKECYLMMYFKQPIYHYFVQDDFEKKKEAEIKLENDLDLLAEELKEEKRKIDAFKWSLMKKKDVVEADSKSIAQFRARTIQIGIPLPKNYHWELDFNDDGIPIIVKDMLDHKGNTHPDIGSIISYALAGKEYLMKKKKMREMNCDQGKPLTLRNPESESVSGIHSNPRDNDANIEIEFFDSKAHYFVKIYFAEYFDLLRKTIFTDGEDEFIRSLGTSGSWYPEGGKSGASFFRTQDERFIFKQLSTVELDCFRKCALKYFDYIYTAFTEKKLTSLGKIYGVYQVAYRNKQDNQEFKMDVLVMEYLFYRKKVNKLWDLKVQDLWGNQIYIHPYSKTALNQAMLNDSHFLTSLDIMDYSLLAGICDDTGEVVIGIVDYMRTFTLDKKFESLVKTALPTPHLPTVVSPRAYCRRFCEAIDVYFPFAPDQWTELNSSGDF
ncbi:hypothetical protein FO519_005499 [Halicephalobus sp. NKZ332]|nr:hypothetical protein FO519_005499 [Halicephalobus sp. NKZ332]